MEWTDRPALIAASGNEFVVIKFGITSDGRLAYESGEGVGGDLRAYTHFTLWPDLHNDAFR